MSYFTYGQFYCVILLIYSCDIQLSGKHVSVLNPLLKKESTLSDNQTLQFNLTDFYQLLWQLILKWNAFSCNI